MMPVAAPDGGASDQVHALARQHACGLGIEQILAQQHADPAERQVENGEIVARRGPAERGIDMYLAIATDQAIRTDQDRAVDERAVDHLRHTCDNMYLRCRGGLDEGVDRRFDLGLDSGAGHERLGLPCE